MITGVCSPDPSIKFDLDTQFVTKRKQQRVLKCPKEWEPINATDRKKKKKIKLAVSRVFEIGDDSDFQ